MEPSKLLDAGALGVIVFLVIYFLAFLERWGKNWQEFMKAQRSEDNGVIKDLVTQVEKLAAQLVELRNDFNDHNVWERTKLDDMARKTTTRKVQ